MKIFVDNVDINLDTMAIITYIIKTWFIAICTYRTFLKFTNTKNKIDAKSILIYMYIFITSILVTIIKYNSNSFMSIISLIFLLALINSTSTKNNVGYSMMLTIISLSFNYIIFVVVVFISFILNLIIAIENDIFNLLIMMIFHIIILAMVFKIKKIRNGIAFLKNTSNDEYFDILILNISVSILFSIIILSNINVELSKSLFICFIIFGTIMFITIQKSLQLYYKQKILVKELEETKGELANKTKEIEELEAENINISKKSHTLSHKQKSLEYKIEQMLTKAEISKEEAAEVKDRLEIIKKDFYKEKVTVELDKTEIPEIDDMLKYMQSECIKNKIDFELQIKGNIHHMINNLITKEDLETLLADHIKNAIIAINHTDNVNRSILVRLGKIDETYSLYIYDSGVEFEKETLENLGNKPSTTHPDEGGTGMGFMNTFDTLRKCKASLIIEEYNKPSKDNYTKAIIIKFDGKSEFKINTYREVAKCIVN